MSDKDMKREVSEKEAAKPASGGEQPTSEPEELSAEQQLAKLNDELTELNTRYLRLAADFDNFKKRSRQERNDLLRYAGVELASLLLPVVDDFERVLEHAPEEAEDGWLKGVRMTVDKLREALATVGVKPIEVQGEHFDPQLHEAIATEVSEAVEEDTVLAEVRRGYQMHERILRPAMVRVSRKPNGTEKVASSDNAAAQEV